MPRTMEVEPAVAVDRAMEMFWTTGYASTSLDQLVQGTGASRYGLYSTFGSKDELLARALGEYSRRIMATVCAPLDIPTASLPEIHEFFHRVRALHKRAGASGCLECNMAIELGQTGSAAARQVGSHFKRMHGLIKRAVNNARKVGHLPHRTDTAHLADYLLGVTAGSFLLARARMGPRMVEAFLSTALEVLGEGNGGFESSRPEHDP